MEILKNINQTHTHEFLANTTIDDNHYHRVAGVSSEAIEVTGGHVHKILANTTYDDEHYHKIIINTGKQIPIGKNKHIHLVEGNTTIYDNHDHSFEFATLIS